MRTTSACLLALGFVACSEAKRAPLVPDASGAAADAAAVAADVVSSTNQDVAPTLPVCAATSAPSPRLPGSRDPDLLARAAAVVGSCLSDDGINRTLSDMWNVTVDSGFFWQRTGLQADCLVNAKCGCAALAACVGFEMSRSETDCTAGCAGSFFTMCTASTDSAWVRITDDCSAVGLGCDTLGMCQDVPTVACDSTKFVPSCGADGRSEICRSKGLGSAVFKGPICETLGLLCSEGVCVGQGASCSGGYPGPEGQTYLEGTGCSGTSLVACVGGQTQTFDCTRIAPGFSCQSVSGMYFCGIASECVPGNNPVGSNSTPNACDGTEVVLCNAGRIDRVDCLALGFKGCEIDRLNGKLGCVPGSAF